MKVMITGAHGFIGKNLAIRLRESPDVEIVPITRTSTECELEEGAAGADFIFHLAGVNRPVDPHEFILGNVEFTRSLCLALARADKEVPVVYASSIKASESSPYGTSKAAGEQLLRDFGQETGCPIGIFRLPNVFGKWCRPCYNSFVATFCHNIARGLPIEIQNPNARVDLVYVDDVVDAFIALLRSPSAVTRELAVDPVYVTTVGEVAAQIRFFHSERERLGVARVGSGLSQALYATYLSALPIEQFSYCLKAHKDARGIFAEVLKTLDSGQFSVFTALPGVTRGGHYHHTKAEKFVIVAGEAVFRLRNILTGEVRELQANGAAPTVVETVPGWAHEVVNVGSSVVIALLWASEVYDPHKPDTILEKV